MALKKDVAGVEDLTFGTGTVTQQRNGKDVTITQINSSHIPYDDTTKIDEAVDRVESIIEAHKNDFNNPHKIDPEDLDAAPLHHTHPISDVDGLQSALDGKSNTNHNHDTVYSKLGHTHEISDVDGLQTDLDTLETQIASNDTDIANLETNKAPTVHQHQISDVENLQPTLDNKANVGDSFLITDHVQEHTGSGDAGKPIILDAEGKIHPSLMGLGLYFVAMYTPVSGDEYPDPTGENAGAYWGVIGVDAGVGYTFEGGDLVGETVYNGDAIVLGTQGWGVVHMNMDPSEYYKLDGSLAITAPFAGGGQQIKNIAPGTEDGDAVEMSQINTFSQDFVKTDGTNPMEAHLDMGGFKISNGSDGTEATDFVTLQQISGFATDFMKLDGSTPMEASLDAGVFPIVNVGESTDNASVATYGQLSTHTGATDNPHSVTAAQVGALTPDGDGSQLTNVDAITLNGISDTQLVRNDVQGQTSVPGITYIPEDDATSAGGAVYFEPFSGTDLLAPIRVGALNNKIVFSSICSQGGETRFSIDLDTPQVTDVTEYKIYTEAKNNFLDYTEDDSVGYFCKGELDDSFRLGYYNDTEMRWENTLHLNMTTMAFIDSDGVPHLVSFDTIGDIKLYDGKLSDIPRGWHICDGTKGTPDMTEDFKTYGTIEVVYIKYIGVENDN